MQRALLSGSLHVLQAYDAWEIYDKQELMHAEGFIIWLSARIAWEIYEE